jgi:hypothetical protein
MITACVVYHFGKSTIRHELLYLIVSKLTTKPANTSCFVSRLDNNNWSGTDAFNIHLSIAKDNKTISLSLAKSMVVTSKLTFSQILCICTHTPELRRHYIHVSGFFQIMVALKHISNKYMKIYLQICFVFSVYLTRRRRRNHIFSIMPDIVDSISTRLAFISNIFLMVTWIF